MDGKGTMTTASEPRAFLHHSLPDHYLTPDDIAFVFRVPLETVYQWRKKRVGPPGFRVGKHVRYDPDVVRNWATEQMQADISNAA